MGRGMANSLWAEYVCPFDDVEGAADGTAACRATVPSGVESSATATPPPPGRSREMTGILPHAPVIGQLAREGKDVTGGRTGRCCRDAGWPFVRGDERGIASAGAIRSPSDRV